MASGNLSKKLFVKVFGHSFRRPVFTGVIYAYINFLNLFSPRGTEEYDGGGGVSAGGIDDIETGIKLFV